MDDFELELDELEDIDDEFLVLDYQHSADELPDETRLEIAYYLGLEAGPHDVCPFEDPDPDDPDSPSWHREAAAEWYRGRAEADHYDIYAIRRGLPSHHYRDPS